MVTPLALKKDLPFPIETGGGDRRVGQPGERDVVEDVVAREALGLAVEDACDQLVTARVVVDHPAARPTGESAIPYNVCGRISIWTVAEALLIKELKRSYACFRRLRDRLAPARPEAAPLISAGTVPGMLV